MIDINLAKIDPEQVFKDPEAVVHCHELTRDQKVEILHRWAYDALELLVAEEENMQAVNPTDRLDEIFKALHKLGAKIQLDNPTATKHGNS